MSKDQLDGYFLVRSNNSEVAVSSQVPRYCEKRRSPRANLTLRCQTHKVLHRTSVFFDKQFIRMIDACLIVLACHRNMYCTLESNRFVTLMCKFEDASMEDWFSLAGGEQVSRPSKSSKCCSGVQFPGLYHNLDYHNLDSFSV